MITGISSDTPLRVANWLANDKHVWLALINDDDPVCRLAAGRHLERICDRSVDFDAYGQPQVRAQQVAAIRTQLLRR
jgi:hypothetical protein